MKILISLSLIIFSLTTFAQIKTEKVEYKQGDTLLEGFAAYDSTSSEKRPGVIVVHEWYGLNEYAKMRAEELAELGYFAFAADIYGKGVRATNNEEAGKLAGKYRKDRELMRARINAAVDKIRDFDLVENDNIAAIGYCFGGGVVLELARSGTDIDGVVSFHGNLDTPNPDQTKNVKAQVLVLHGADDPHVPQEQVHNFMEEMDSADVKWQMNFYSDAVHSFTNPKSGADPSTGVAYNERAAKRSWEAMKIFFEYIFKNN